MKQILISLRPGHCVKNLFLFLPLIFGGKLFEYPPNLRSALAFLIFSMAAGAVYIANDIIDFERDRIHPVKCHRPIASGRLAINSAVASAIAIGAASAILAFVIDMAFGAIVIVYFVYNYLYSKVLKELVVIDVFCIGGFFLLRILAGAYVSDVDLSYWIVIMTVLLSLFLGFNKRRQELRLLEERASEHRHVLTKYNAYFIDQLSAVITSSLVVVYMLYTIDARTVGVFGTRHLVCSVPFVYYGIFRFLYLVHVRREEADAVKILLNDRMMLANIILWAGVCIGIIYFGL